MNRFKAMLAGLALAGGAVLASGAANAVPLAPLAQTVPSGIESVRLVCDAWGRCWRRPNYYYGGPVVVGPGFYGPPRRYYGGPRYYGPRPYGPRYGYGYRGW